MNKTKILVLGASGMAGHVVYTYLRDKLDSKYIIKGTINDNDFGRDTEKINVFNTEDLKKKIDDFQPDFLINCIGMLIRGSKKSPDKAIYANSYLPHLLASYSKEKRFKLIHISTDCVFSGDGEGGYTEDSLKDAKDVYGLSKSLGEIIDENNITIRTSIIGPEIKKDGEGLFHWFMGQNGEVNGYKSNYWSGVTTFELAKFILWIIEGNLDNGLYHLTNNEPISKYDLLKIFAKVYNKKIIISSEKDYSCNKSFICTNKKNNYKVPTYHKMIVDQKDFMIDNKEFYKYYF